MRYIDRVSPDAVRFRGVTYLHRANPMRSDMTASLVSFGTRRFLVYRNYEVLLAYNCAHAYALSVSLLSDSVAGGPLPAPPKRAVRPRRRR